MSLQYSGTATPVNTTFVSDGTRAQLQSQLVTALTTAGWTTISGGGTSDTLMESIGTPQGFKIRFRVFDPGSGNCMQVTMKDTTGSITGQVCFLLPTNGQLWRIIANKYSFYMFISGSGNVTAPRGFCMGGTMWVPTFMATYFGASTSLGWSHYGGLTDIDAAARQSFRTCLGGGQALSGSTIFGGQVFNYNNTNFTGPELICDYSGSTAHGYRWEDGSPILQEPLISWAGMGGVTTESRLKGMLFDAFITTQDFGGEAVATFDSHNWIAITNNNTTTAPRGTLFVLVS